MNREKIALELIKTAKELVSFEEFELVTDAQAYHRDFYIRGLGDILTPDEGKEKTKGLKILLKAAKDYAKIISDLYGEGGSKARIKKWRSGMGFTVELPTPIRSYVFEDEFTKKFKSLMKKHGVTVDENYLGEFD